MDAYLFLCIYFLDPDSAKDLFFFFKQKTAYDIETLREFRRVLFRSTPKAAVHLHHDMLVCCEAFGRHVLEIGPEDRTFSVAKLFFAYGLGNALYFPFHVGASTVLYPGRPEPAKVFDVITRERPTLV